MAAAGDGTRATGDTPGILCVDEAHAVTTHVLCPAVAREITEVFEQSNGTYGSPRVTHALRSRGHVVTRKTVERSMRRAHLRATLKKRYLPTTDSSNTLAPAPILLQRSIDVKQINRVWVSDFRS